MTFPCDLAALSDIEASTSSIANDVGREVVAAGHRVRRVAVTVRTSTFYTRTKITTLPEPTSDVATIEQAARTVLARFPLDRPVRLLAVRVEFAD